MWNALSGFRFLAVGLDCRRRIGFHISNEGKGFCREGKGKVLESRLTVIFTICYCGQGFSCYNSLINRSDKNNEIALVSNKTNSRTLLLYCFSKLGITLLYSLNWIEFIIHIYFLSGDDI